MGHKYRLDVGNKWIYLNFDDDETAIRELETKRFKYGGEGDMMELAKDITKATSITDPITWDVIKIWKGKWMTNN